MQVIRIAAGDISAEVVPPLGAGLASFDLAGQALLRRWAGSADPLGLASMLLLPWSNRVSNGGFVHDGLFHPLPRNLTGPLPIHGNGFQLEWSVVDQRPDSVEMTVFSDGPGPYRYQASSRYSVSPTGLRMDLCITNQADIALPFGLGFHPWLVRTPRSKLTADLSQAWLEDSTHLPDRLVPIAQTPQWDFRRGRTLPKDWINNAFSWTGQARVDWPELGLGLVVSASANLGWAILYSPSAREEFFCFEPVMHPVNAYWLPGGAAENGMAVLQPQQSLSIWVQFDVAVD